MAMLTIRSFQTAKAGNRPDQCEDASRIRLSGDGPVQMAICDGASESAFARPWARILADALVTRPIDMDKLDDSSLAEWLEPCVMQWNGVVPWGRLPWHGQAKTRTGSMSTFLGMTAEWSRDHSGSLTWRAAAVGDCCLFVVRDGTLAVSFPMEESGQFNITPPLVCSNPANNGRLWPHLRQMRGECLPGDLMIMASDALACWILLGVESGGRPWEDLLALASQEEWRGWVQAKRDQRAMRNDDTTMITVKAA